MRSVFCLLAALAVCCSAGRAAGQTFFPAAGTSADNISAANTSTNGPPPSIYLTSNPAPTPPASEPAGPAGNIDSLPPAPNEPGQSWFARQAAQQPADYLRSL